MNSKKKLVIGVLCIALVFIGIGFAAFSTSLNLSGTAISSGFFDVKITNYVLDTTKKTSGATDTTAAITNNHAVTEQTLSATFNEPGDYITWTLTVTNRGTIAATFTVEAEPQEATSGAYKLSCNAAEGTPLAPSATTTFQCEMSFDKNRTLTAQEFATLPKGTNITMTVHVIAVQSSNYVTPTPQVTPPQLMILKSYNSSTGEYTDVNEPVLTYGVSNLVNGDLLGYDTEQFYVLDTSGNSIRVLTRYLLNVGPNKRTDITEGLQNAEIGYTLNSSDEATNYSDSSTYQTYAAVVFSDIIYWSNISNYPNGISGYPFVYNSNSNIYQYINGQNGYVNILSTMGLTVTDGTLLSLEEMNNICNASISSDTMIASSCPKYIYETSYWFGTAGNEGGVWGVVAIGLATGIYHQSDADYGVRPVLTIALS